MAFMKCSFCGKSAGYQMKSKDFICSDCIKKLGGMQKWGEIRKMSPDQVHVTLDEGLLNQTVAPADSKDKPKRKHGCLIAVMIPLVIIGVAVAALVAIPTDEAHKSEPTSVSKPEQTAQSKEVAVFENADIKVIYQGVTDVVGNVGFQFTLENKTDTEITVHPNSASINDHMVTLFSGVPATIRPGKKFTQVWFTGPDAAGVSSYKDVKEIELILMYAPSDDSIMDGKKTKLIHIDV